MHPVAADGHWFDLHDLPAGRPRLLSIPRWWRVADRAWAWTGQPERVRGVDRAGGEGDDRVQRPLGRFAVPGQTASVRRSQCMTSRHGTPGRQEKVLLDTTGRK